MTDLTIFVPTRGRVGRALEFQECFNDTARGNSEVIFVVSTDDEKYLEYLRARDAGKFARPIIEVSPVVRGMSDPLNRGFNAWMNNPRIFPSFAVGFMGDDHRPRTLGWDVAYLEALTEQAGRCRQRVTPGVGMVFGNDLLQGEAVPTQIAMTTNIPATLGRMVPNQLAHLYTDNYWLELGRGLGRLRYLSEVVIEHMHPGIGKAVIDAGYEFSGNYSLDMMDKDTFEGVVRNEILPRDIAKIKRLM
jgi:hypothetical protein